MKVIFAEFGSYKRYSVFPPYGLLKIGAYFKSKGHSVRLLDCLSNIKKTEIYKLKTGNFEHNSMRPMYLYGTTYSDLKKELVKQKQPDEIWVTSVFTYSWISYHKTIEICKEVFPDSKVILGGLYATLCPEKAKESKADKIFIGEMHEADHFFPDYSLTQEDHRFFFLNTTKGCCNKCSYCSVPILENKIIFYPPERIVDYIEENIRKFKFKSLYFFDNNLLMNSKNHFELILDLMEKRGINIKIPFLEHGLESDLLNPGILDKLVRFGYETASFSLESIHQKDRKRFYRPDSILNFINAIKISKQRGLKVRTKVMIGLPNQTVDEILESVSFVYEKGCSPELLPFTPIPQTEEYLNHAHLIKGKKLEELDPLLWPMENKNMRAHDLDYILTKFDKNEFSAPEILAMRDENPIIIKLKQILKNNLTRLAFFKIDDYANVSHKIIDNDILRYFSEYFECEIIQNGASGAVEKVVEEATSKRVKYIFLNDVFDPTELFKYRSEKNIEINFIIYPYLFERWQPRFKSIVRYLWKDDVIIPFSKYLQKSVSLISSRYNTFYMPIPVDIKSYSSISHKNKELELVYCGRMVPEKGLLPLLETLIIEDKGARLHIISPICGLRDTNEKKYYCSVLQFIKDNNLEDRILFYGSLEDNQDKKKAIFSQSDVLVHLSTDTNETFGRVIIEAFAAGLAVITTDWQSLNELVVNGENGFLIKVQDNIINPIDVKKAIEKLSSQDTLHKIRTNNKAKANQFDYRNNVQRFRKYLLSKKSINKTRDHAIYIRNLNDRELCDNYHFNRVYFGNEFCERLIPSSKEIDQILDFCRIKNMPLTFVTPYCTDFGIQRLSGIFSRLPKSTEVVFNDWGLLHSIKKNQLTPILGRLLISIKRDPRIRPDSGNMEYYRMSNINTDFQDFIMDQGIFRIELDNVYQGYDYVPKEQMNFSMYYPYVYIATSRKCLFAKDREGIGACSIECNRYSLKAQVNSKNYSKIIIKGNSQFYKNDSKPKRLEKQNIDRLVFMPRLPFAGSYTLEWDNYYKDNPDSAAWGVSEPDRHVVNYIESFNFPRGTKILDSGCGHGKNSEFFINKGYETYGIDISKNAIKYIKRRLPQGKFEVQDVRELKFKESFFDVICDAGCFHVNYPQDREDIISNYYNVLKSKGHLHLRIFRNESQQNRIKPLFYTNNLPAFGLSKKEILLLFEDKFIIEKMILDEDYNGRGLFYLCLTKR